MPFRETFRIDVLVAKINSHEGTKSESGTK